MREKILLEQAVEIIKEWHNLRITTGSVTDSQMERAWEIYYNNAPEMKPIREALSAPESGQKLRKHAKYSWNKTDTDTFTIWHIEGITQTFIADTDTAEKAHLLTIAANNHSSAPESGGDDVPNKSNSDVTPVASHSSTSSNSIEHEILKRAIQLRMHFGWRQGQSLFNALREINSEIAEKVRGKTFDPFHRDDVIFSFFIEVALLYKEQEDKRSVATKADSSNDAGNQNGLTDK